MGTKLTKRQVEALAALDSWRRGMQIATTNLRADGVSLTTLRSLEAAEMVNSVKFANGIFWNINDVGREALREASHEH